MAPAKPKKPPSKAQKKQAPKARAVNHYFPRPPVADLCVHLPRHISEGVFVPASAKEDQKYRNDVSRFYDGVEIHIRELEEQLVKESAKHPPGHPKMKEQAEFLENGRALVAKLRLKTGKYALKDELRQELMNLFPEVWERYHKFDARSKNADGSLKLKDAVATKTKEEELDGSIEPLLPGMPLKMGFMLKTSTQV